MTTHAPTLGQAIAAWVDGRAISEDEVDRRLGLVRNEAGADSLPASGSPEDRRLRRWVVQTLVDEALVEREASRAGRRRRRESWRPLDDATVVDVFEHVVGEVEVGDDEVARYHHANQRAFSAPELRGIAQVVTTDNDTAHGLASRAAATDLDRAVRSWDDPPERLVLERAELRRGAVGGELEAQIWRAQVGEVLTPVRTPAGWHVVELRSVRPERCRPLAEVRASIREDLLAAARGARFDAWLAEGRRRHVTLAPGNEHPGDPGAPDPVHRH